MVELIIQPWQKHKISLIIKATGRDEGLFPLSNKRGKKDELGLAQG